MKKLLLFVFAALAFAACTQDVLVDITPAPIVDEAPETLVVGFEGDDTRIQLQNGKTVWTKGDLVSVFYKSDGNDCWKFTGETGERNGTLQRVSVGEYYRRGDYVIVAYPYNRDYLISLASNTIETTLPAVQEYATGSFGVGSSPMVAMGDYKQFALKNTCGWLKLQLTGNGEMVRSITLRGNNGEQVAGDILIVAEDASVVLADASIDVEDNEVGGSLLGDDDILKEVTLDCGEGVTLGKSATAFYIALPPQTFTQGLTVEITDNSGYTMTQATDKEVAIERNTIQPMAAINFVNPNTPAQPTPANNQIWYTAKIMAEPNLADKYAFGADLISNEWDSETGKGIITFDGNVTMVGNKAFYNCDNFITITLPDSVTTIGNDAFDSCDSLTSVNIPDSVKTIGEAAFYSCDSLTSVTIGNSVTTIGNAAFSYCYSLTSVNIPDSVTIIGDWAFQDCYSLTSVNIGDNVTTIGDWAFSHCSNLREFTGKYAADGGRCLIIDNTIIAYAEASGTTYNIPESVTTIGNSAFYNCTSLTSVSIPDSVTTIGNAAFCGCTSLTSVNIPESVTTIGNDAFDSCESLTSANIPDSVTTIGNSAFYYCTSLTSITIGNSVTTIGDYAFRICSSLTSVTIPDSVTTIGNEAFYDCKNLKYVYCKATTPPALGGSDVFDYNASGRRIIVPIGSGEAYKKASYWSEYADSIFEDEF